MTPEPDHPVDSPPESAKHPSPAPKAPNEPKAAKEPGAALDARPFLEATADAKSRYGRFNLAVIGASGVGKSSLVNAVFQRDWAEVGIGLPVTRGVQYYHDDSLGIWDVEGFEIGSAVTPADQLRAHLAVISGRPASEQIAVVWYCVKISDARITDADIAMIRELDRAGLPVILVLTKVDWEKNQFTGKRSVRGKDEKRFLDWLQNPVDRDGSAIDIPYRRVIPTSVRDKYGKVKGHGLGELVAETLSLSPSNEKDAFRIAQRLNLPWKREMARPVILAAAGAAATAAAVPLPVADAVALAPIQLGMMGRIAAIYDLELKTMMSAGALAQLAVQMTGQALARSALKLIPGAGSVIGASIAAALTTATGEGWVRLCEQVHTGKLDLAKIAQAWGDYAPGFFDVVKKLAEQRLTK